MSDVMVFLTTRTAAFVDREDYYRVAPYAWVLSPSRRTFYAATRIKRPDGTTLTISMHRMLMNAQPGEIIDHINHNGLDNRRSVNLRRVTAQQNSHNRRPNGQYRGVHLLPEGKWRAAIGSARVGKTFLGDFFTAEEAALAYNAAALERYGAYAFLNQVDPTHRGAR